MRENEDVEHPPQNLWRSDEEEEDPLVTLGHMVKIASVGIWRKVSMRDKKIRPGMQKRSNSDSVLEIGTSVTCTDTGDEVLVELVEEETSDDKTPLPQTEATATTERPDGEAVVVQTEVTPTDPIPTQAS